MSEEQIEKDFSVQFPAIPLNFVYLSARGKYKTIYLNQIKSQPKGTSVPNVYTLLLLLCKKSTWAVNNVSLFWCVYWIKWWKNDYKPFSSDQKKLKQIEGKNHRIRCKLLHQIPSFFVNMQFLSVGMIFWYCIKHKTFFSLVNQNINNVRTFCEKRSFIL